MPLDMSRVHGVGGAVIFALSILCAALILRDRRAYPKLYPAQEAKPERKTHSEP